MNCRPPRMRLCFRRPLTPLRLWNTSSIDMLRGIWRQLCCLEITGFYHQRGCFCCIIGGRSMIARTTTSCNSGRLLRRIFAPKPLTVQTTTSYPSTLGTWSFLWSAVSLEISYLIVAQLFWDLQFGVFQTHCSNRTQRLRFLCAPTTLWSIQHRTVCYDSMPNIAAAFCGLFIADVLFWKAFILPIHWTSRAILLSPAWKDTKHIA